jgi:hypothetical protein
MKLSNQVVIALSLKTTPDDNLDDNLSYNTKWQQSHVVDNPDEKMTNQNKNVNSLTF